MLGLLLRAEKPLAEDLLVTLLRITAIGGHGTPGAALAWAIREMDAQAGVRERLRAEAAGLADAVDTGELRSPAYTTAFVKEILRAYTPAWLLTRMVTTPVRLRDWTLPAGQRILLSPYLVHRDERWWEEPDRVEPRRWLSGTRPHAEHAYLPFGAGPCKRFGSRIGMALLTIAVAALAGSHRVTGPDWSQIPHRPDVLLVPGPARVRFEAVTTRAEATRNGEPWWTRA